MSVRSISYIGALWPLCGNCKHIAQDHDIDGCGAVGRGQCRECGQWTDHAKCKCKEYVGPTWEEFKAKFLTPEEIEYYHWDKENNEHTTRES